MRRALLKWVAKRWMKDEFRRAYDLGRTDAYLSAADNLEVMAQIYRGEEKPA